MIWSNSHRYGTEIRLMDRIADPTDYEERCMLRIEFESVLGAIRTLPDERMKKILFERYLSGEKKIFRQLAKEMGLSRERVRQLEEDAFRRIRKVLKKP